VNSVAAPTSFSGGTRQPIDPAKFTPFFAYRNGSLHCESVSLAALADRVGTPAYVYSSAAVEAAYRRMDAAFRAVPHAICYAVKANSNLSILRLFARLGSSFDIVSGGELDRVRRIGVAGNRIVFSGVGKTREEIREALQARVLLLNVESQAELELIAGEASRLRIRAPLSLRVNPDVEAGGHPHISTGRHRHKFGIEVADARRLYQAHRKSHWICWKGISAHIGSQILSLAPFRRAARSMAALVRGLAREGIALQYFDFGGGLGVRYTNEHPPDVREYARAIVREVKPLDCKLLLEPGRSLIAAAGVLLTRVLYTKQTGKKNFIIVDAAMNDLIRPALYGAIHPATTAARNRKRRIIRAEIVGPVCETGDCFLNDWPIGEVAPGDLLVIWNAGAYGFILSSNYNSRPRPCEVLIDRARARVIRRRESRADLVRGET
jgi:diaminopimelate decarboxylase